VLASGGHGDVMPNDHELYIGQAGPRGNDLATGLLRDADVVLAIGTRLGYNTTLFNQASLAPAARVVQVDITAEAIGRHFPVEVGMVADAGEAVRALAPLVSAQPRRSVWVEEAKAGRVRLLADRAAMVDREPEPMHPLTAVAAVQRALPRDAIVCADTGTTSLPVIDGVQTFVNPGLLTPLDFGLVGFSFPAALGAKAAAPDRPVVSFTGDGAFSMAMIELATAMEARLNTVTVILNNSCWGAEKAYQRDFFGSRFVGSDLRNPDFATIAKAYGARGVRTDSPAELSEVVAAALVADVPTVIDVDIRQDTMTSLRRDFFPHRPAPHGS
jgi:acetolactate synthase-1/2/3 large subunit/sulfoacetaldehyde acetyltransferase